MTKNAWENKSLVWIIGVCYAGNLVFGWVGYFLCEPSSVAQLLVYQLGNACAISGSVMAARYVGLQGQQVAASVADSRMLWSMYLFKDWRHRQQLTTSN